MLPWNRSSLNFVAAGLGLAITAHCSIARPQSPAPVAQLQPAVSPILGEFPNLALPLIDDAQRIPPGDIRPVSMNLFGQERDSFDQVNEAQQSAQPIVPPVPGTSRPVVPPVPAPSAADADLLRQAGIVL